MASCDPLIKYLISYNIFQLTSCPGVCWEWNWLPIRAPLWQGRHHGLRGPLPKELRVQIRLRRRARTTGRGWGPHNQRDVRWEETTKLDKKYSIIAYKRGPMTALLALILAGKALIFCRHWNSVKLLSLITKFEVKIAFNNQQTLDMVKQGPK